MKARSLFFLRLAYPLALAGLVASAAPAGAIVEVVGNSLAHDCFLLAKAGNTPQEGIKTCNSALVNEALSPHDRAATIVNRGVLKIALKDYDDALADYNAGIAAMPELGDAYVDRGGALIFLKRYDEAMADIAHGMSLGMSFPYVGYYNRAVAEELMGRYTDAYHDFQHTLELEPNFTLASQRLKDFVVTSKPAPPAPPKSGT